MLFMNIAIIVIKGMAQSCLTNDSYKRTMLPLISAVVYGRVQEEIKTCLQAYHLISPNDPITLPNWTAVTAVHVPIKIQWVLMERI